jgi:hypothetical protein
VPKVAQEPKVILELRGQQVLQVLKELQEQLVIQEHKVL